MIASYREQFNRAFTEEKYREFSLALGTGYPPIPFRVAETPVFIPADLKDKLIAAGDEIIKFIKQPDFKALTQKSIPEEWDVPGENDHPHFLTFDFGICKDAHGELSPILIELQGFPSLYGFQSHLAETYKKVFELQELRPYFEGLNQNEYFNLLRKVIVGAHEPHEVVLMDIHAAQQKTAIDFFITAKYLGIKVLDLTDIKKIDGQLFYENNGTPVRIKRIYNRLIFDEMIGQKELFEKGFDPLEPLDVEWITHPNWFYRISKYTMPFLKGNFVPETHFLNTLKTIPADLENYVLKPLFSFAGMGVVIDIKQSNLDKIADPENWILQRKVNYEPAVQAPDGGVKVEIRLMYVWVDNEEPQLCMNLARLSKGKMIGVRYNKDFDWVGGTVGLMM